MSDESELTATEQAILLATYFRGGHPSDQAFVSNSDQIVILSLFYTGDISADECTARFSNRKYMNQSLYNNDCELPEEIADRYRLLINLLTNHSGLIEGGGNFRLPAHPTFTSCRLTEAGFQLVERLASSFSQKPDFRWPDKRSLPIE